MREREPGVHRERSLGICHRALEVALHERGPCGLRGEDDGQRIELHGAGEAGECVVLLVDVHPRMGKPLVRLRRFEYKLLSTKDLPGGGMLQMKERDRER